MKIQSWCEYARLTSRGKSPDGEAIAIKDVVLALVRVCPRGRVKYFLRKLRISASISKVVPTRRVA